MDIMNKTGLLVGVYRDAKLGDCTAGGPSSKHDRLVLIIPDKTLPFKPESEEEACYIDWRKGLMGSEDRLWPVIRFFCHEGKHTMFGGNFVHTSDSRFPWNYPIPIHDRVETYEEIRRID